MISGVEIHPLRQIADERGKIMHMMRCDSPFFESFGEIYFSTVNQDVIKAWKIHRKMILNLAVPLGKIKLVLFDGRESSPTRGELQEILLGEDLYSLVKIPPGIWNGFKGLSPFPAFVANCASLPHDPSEIERMEINNNLIPYHW